MGNNSGNNPKHGQHNPKGQPTQATSTAATPGGNRPQQGGGQSQQRPMAGQHGQWKQPQTTAQPTQGKPGGHQPGQKR